MIVNTITYLFSIDMRLLVELTLILKGMIPHSIMNASMYEKTLFEIQLIQFYKQILMKNEYNMPNV